MDPQNDCLRDDYRSSMTALLAAITTMARSVDTPNFDDAFWKVQAASERWKKLRAGFERRAGIHEML